MAYTIVKSNGTVLTTIADGTINTSSTSLALPGRNYAGYGSYLDTNFVHALENFASTTPPSNPLQGQLWYNTNANTLCVCPADGTSNISSWITLAQSGSGGTTTFGTVTVTGTLTAGNIATGGTLSVGGNSTFTNISISGNANIAVGNITAANIGTLTTQLITTGAVATAGTLTGDWTVNNSIQIYIASGNAPAKMNTNGVYANAYFYANGSPFNPSGTYNNSNVSEYLSNASVSGGRFAGTIFPSSVTTTTLTTGANTTAGQITGNWALTTGSRLNATYADLAERFEADAYYDAGTVVELGGEKEITSVRYELSEDIFGVISDTAAYLMNSAAGDNTTHPPVAMTGRVQVKVTGIVKKGDRLVSAGNGIARAAQVGEATAFNVIGRALENKTTTNIGTVLAIVTVSK
jgi:Peptidase_G2, IMC autoproteolytic cleavage domain